MKSKITIIAGFALLLAAYFNIFGRLLSPFVPYASLLAGLICLLFVFSLSLLGHVRTYPFLSILPALGLCAAYVSARTATLLAAGRGGFLSTGAGIFMLSLLAANFCAGLYGRRVHKELPRWNTRDALLLAGVAVVVLAMDAHQNYSRSLLGLLSKDAYGVRLVLTLRDALYPMFIGGLCISPFIRLNTPNRKAGWALPAAAFITIALLFLPLGPVSDAFGRFMILPVAPLTWILTGALLMAGLLVLRRYNARAKPIDDILTCTGIYLLASLYLWAIGATFFTILSMTAYCALLCALFRFFGYCKPVPTVNTLPAAALCAAFLSASYFVNKDFFQSPPLGVAITLTFAVTEGLFVLYERLAKKTTPSWNPREALLILGAAALLCVMDIAVQAAGNVIRANAGVSNTTAFVVFYSVDRFIYPLFIGIACFRLFMNRSARRSALSTALILLTACSLLLNGIAYNEGFAAAAFYSMFSPALTGYSSRLWHYSACVILSINACSLLSSNIKKRSDRLSLQRPALKRDT